MTQDQTPSPLPQPDAFILYSLPLRSDDTPPAWANWEMARGMRDLLERYDIAGTWLPRFDAIADPEYRDLCLGLGARQEVGLWMEITRSHAAAAGVPYRLEAGRHWYEAQFCLTLGYAPEERLRLCDVAMDLFHRTFGRHPRTVAMWMLDSTSADYLAARYGVRMVGLCRNQYGVDGYTLWGGWPNLPWRPARRYIWQPAAEVAEAAPYWVWPLISEDLVVDYGNDRGIWSTEVSIIQQRNLPGETVEDYINPLSELCLRGKPVALASYVAENGWRWDRLRPCYERQLAWLAEREATRVARSVTAREYGEWLDRRWPGPSPMQVWYQPPGLPNSAEQFGAIMACTGRYRARARVCPSRGIFDLTDLRAYPAGAEDPYTRSLARERFGRWIHPFLLDAARFRPEGRTKSPIADVKDPVMALSLVGEADSPPCGPGELTWPAERTALWRQGDWEAEWHFGPEEIELRAHGPKRLRLELRVTPQVLPLVLLIRGGEVPLRGLPVGAAGEGEELILVNVDPEARRCALRVVPDLPCERTLWNWTPGEPMGRLRIETKAATLALRLTPGVRP